MFQITAKFVPHFLTDEQKQELQNDSSFLSKAIRAHKT